ncbi:phosphodiester glycosidase family protein [Terrabacter aerolatus]|uniref:Phosphodiester glycosidase domain-containing protein n=1 Tax=Terrabacter aerolatus TaxID=422442 RepID=A0A512D4L4_9MICO|nr:hypothetical protein TAE01_32240 [Terrabacter aerolatus]
MVVAVLVVAVGVSYGQALLAPGDAPLTVRTVEWVRDNGGAGVVDAVENWWFTRNPPPNAAPDPSALPDLPPPQAGTRAAGTSHPGRPGTTSGPPTVTIPSGITPVAREGVWVPGRLDRQGLPAMFTTFVQPDPTHASVVAAVAWIRASDTVGHLVAGTTQPGGDGWPDGARVAPGDVSSLVATFNSGWRFKDLLGGFYENGRYSHSLQTGAGSVVIDRTGRVTVGQWGRDVTMSPSVVAVRQNLHLIVDAGAAEPGIADASGPWGVSKNQRQFTWRSGLGIDAHGNLIYVAGDGMTLKMLTAALVAAKATRAVELDMHTNMVFFARWAPTAANGPVSPAKLLPTMPSRADRYIAPDQRDFFYVTLR